MTEIKHFCLRCLLAAVSEFSSVSFYPRDACIARSLLRQRVRLSVHLSQPVLCLND